jgi:hypothetical protein
MKRLVFFIALFMASFSMNFMSLAQTVSARDQCLKLGRGVNIIGYDKAFWQDYTKGRFTHQGAPWSKENKDLSGITWTGTPDEKTEVESKLKVAADWSLKNDRPIFLGEFGAYDKGDMDSRARYTAFVARTAEKLGFSWAYWQFDSDFIVYNIDKECWVEPILNALMNR